MSLNGNDEVDSTELGNLGSEENNNQVKEAGATKRKLPSWMDPNATEENESLLLKKTKSNEQNTAEEEGGEENLENGGNSSAESSAEPVKIKDEPIDEGFEAPTTSSNSDENETASSSGSNNGASVAIKTEAEEDDKKPSCSGTSNINKADIKPAVKVEKADATSTKIERKSCKYGIKCYRQNPMHKIEEAHPGDADYRRPHFPSPPPGTPSCPFGNSCYRRNPVHFQQYSHPPDTNFEENYKNFRMRLRKRRQQQKLDLGEASFSGDESGNSTDWDDYDLNDPFINDDSDYQPSDDSEYDEDEEFHDDMDKVEE